MKRILMTATALLALSSSIKAQEIYEHILGNATRIINTPSTSFTQNRIAFFKWTALTYIGEKSLEENMTDREKFLDTQAYSLSEFMNLFYHEVLENHKLSESERPQRLNIFVKATRSYPLFSDSDDNVTQQFVRSGTELTPFSLNTDWEKVLAEVRSHL